MDKSAKAKCNSIYVNLLMLSHAEDLTSSAYIREFFETSRCDEVFDLSAQRKDLEVKVNAGDPTRMNRIMAHTQTDIDESFAAQAQIHYSGWQQRQLLQAVTWGSWIRYHTVDRAERTLAALGIAGAGFAGLRAAQTSFRHLRQAAAIRKVAAPTAAELVRTEAAASTSTATAASDRPQ